MISNKTTILKFLILLLLVLMEFYLLRNINTYTVAFYSFTSFILIFISVIYAKRKQQRITISFLKHFKGDVLNWYGLFFLLYLMGQLSFLFDLTLQFVLSTAQDQGHELFRVFVVFSFLFMPFVINLLFFNVKPLSKTNPNPRVLFIGVSLNNYIIEPGNWNTWDPIRKSLVKNQSVERVVLIVSQLLVDQDSSLSIDEAKRLTGLEKAIVNIRKSINVDRLLLDVGSFYDASKTIQSKIVELSKIYNDEDMIFHITSSTSIVTACLTISAIKGNRNMEYIKQIPDKQLQLEEMPVNIDIDVYSISELWDEILERISDH